MFLKSFIKELPETDQVHEVAKEIPLVKKLIETGYTLVEKVKVVFIELINLDGKKSNGSIKP